MKNEFLKKLVIPLLAHCLMLTVAPADQGSFIKSDPIQLYENTSSSVFNEFTVKSDVDCMIRCVTKGCALASVNDVSRLCQLIVLNDACNAPNDTKVRRVLGAVAGDQVWKAADFEDQLRNKKCLPQIIFRNSSTGTSGSVQSLRVTTTGCYRIEANGAKGGTSSKPNSYVGGYGARMSGNFNLTVGTDLSIVVGQRGSDSTEVNVRYCGGGGGGTFVYRSADNFLLVAAGGGGGGTGGNAYSGLEGSPGQASQSGSDTPPIGNGYMGFGGTDGQAGRINSAATFATYYFGGAGAGWLGKCTVTQRTAADGQSGGSRVDGWVGGLAGTSNSGAVGGFGGGGGAGSGGGGYSGGGAGSSSDVAGGGGGSFCGGGGCNGTTGGNTDSDQGLVTFELVSNVCQ